MRILCCVSFPRMTSGLDPFRFRLLPQITPNHMSLGISHRGRSPLSNVDMDMYRLPIQVSVQHCSHHVAYLGNRV